MLLKDNFLKSKRGATVLAVFYTFLWGCAFPLVKICISQFQIADTDNNSKTRLKTLCDNSDGFKIADEDLKLRGPGDFIGQRQHGLPTLRIADMEKDMGVLKTAGIYAKRTLSLDPYLSENKELKAQIENLYSDVAEN